MPVLAEMLGTDVSKLILRLDLVDTDFPSLTSSWTKKKRKATCFTRGL